MPTVTWTNEHPLVPDARFPSVELPHFTWVAWHSCTDQTDWIDGRIEFGNDRRTQLDLVAIDKPDEEFDSDDFDPTEMRRLAREAWDAGRVHVHKPEADAVPALIVPTDDFTKGDIIAEAIARFRP